MRSDTGLERRARRALRSADALDVPAAGRVSSLTALVGDPAALSILDVMTDPRLFGSSFAGATWDAWRVFLAALFGLLLTPDELAIFQRHTGREAPTPGATAEADVIVGRRGGKSRIAGLVAVFLSCFRDYRSYLAPGERGTVMVLAADRRQARVVFRYIGGLLDSVPALRAMVVKRRRDAIELANGVAIEVHTSSYRAVRGYTLVAVIADETAFWRTEDGAANPDSEVLAALRPALATIPYAVLLKISTPYGRRGELWDSYEAHYGKDGDPVLVWQADTASMNPAVDPAVIAKAYADDPAAAEAEYGAKFRSDVAAFIPREALDAVVMPGRLELPPMRGVRYLAFADPSGGSRDAFTLAIAHREGTRAVLDAVRETVPPFSPEDVVKDFAALLKSYGLRDVRGDHYAGIWPAERFQRHGITYHRSDLSKSDMYSAALPLFMGGRVELLDLPRLRGQLAALERRTARGGRDSVDHPRNGRDDVANAAVGALLAAVPVLLQHREVTERVYA